MSWPELFLRYVRERFPLRVFLPLAAVLLLLAAAAGQGMPSLAWGIGSFVAILPLLLALRILDDLADVEHDRVRHPGRITARVGRAAPLGALAVLAFLIATAAAVGGAARGRAFVPVGTVAMLGAWYVLRSRLGAGPLANTLVVLLKYPAIVVAAAPAGASPGLLVPLAATAYLGVLVHDLADDPDLRRMNGGAS